MGIACAKVHALVLRHGQAGQCRSLSSDRAQAKEKELIIDGRAHLQGRLASVVAKELLSGQRVIVVRCEQILKSGSLKRN